MIELLVTAILGFAGAQASNDMPLFAGDNGEGQPTWVSHRTVSLSRGGVLSSDYLPNGVFEDLKDNLAAAVPDKNGCHETRRQSSALEKSLEERVAEVSWIGFGEVVALDHGFYHGRPGTLLKIQVTEEINRTTGPQVRFFYHPSANFDLQGIRLCFNERPFVPVPKIGDEVALLLDEQFADEEYLWGNDADTLILMPSAGADFEVSRRLQVDSHVREGGKQSLKGAIYSSSRIRQ